MLSRMEPAVNIVVEVFMERRSEYLPRLRRIAEVIAECASASLSHTTPIILGEACDNSNPLDSNHATIRFRLQSGEVSAEIAHRDSTASSAQVSPGSTASSAEVDFCLLRQ